MNRILVFFNTSCEYIALLAEARLAGQSQAWADVATRDEQTEKANLWRF